MFKITFIQYKLFIILFIFQCFIKLSYQTLFSQNKIFKGNATTYGGSINGGSCGFKQIWSNPILNSQLDFSLGVAINSKQYNNSLSCGRCIKIEYQNNQIFNSIYTIVTDICVECNYGDLDLFTNTYNNLIKESPGRKLITWKYINCPQNIVSNNLQLRINELNYYWLSIQPENFLCGISNLFIFQNNVWIQMTRDDSKMMGLYFIYSKKLVIPFKFKIINIFNEEIITQDYYKLEHLFILNKQFLCNSNISSINEIAINSNSDIITDFNCN